MTDYALTSYPLSADFRRRLEAQASTRPTYLDYAELRKLSPLSLVRKLRGLGARSLLLPIEDECSRCVLPMM